MPKRRPSADIDEDVIQLGTGTMCLEQYEKPIHEVPKKPPIGFLPWPKPEPEKPKRKTRKRRT